MWQDDLSAGGCPSVAGDGAPAGLSRRGFLQVTALAGGGALFGVGLPGFPAAARAAGDGAFAPNAFIRIGRDNSIAFILPRVEMGQDTYTSLAVMIAEELEVDPGGIALEHAPADDNLYGNPMLGFQVTGGSTSIRSAWEPMRQAGAGARMMLVAAAARTWGVPESECAAQDGAVTHRPSGRRLAYGVLAEVAATLGVPREIPLKPPERFKRIGVARNRLDAAGKVNGEARYGIDARPPGVRIAAIQNCPVRGGTVATVDDAAALQVRGVSQVVRVDNAVAVVAEHTGAARKGLAALEVTWDGGENASYSTEKMIAELAEASQRSGATARNEGDVDAAAKGAARTLDAIYQQPFLAHACMEPVNCTVHVRPDGCELWLGIQVPARAQAIAAQVLGLPQEKVVVHNHLLGGGFGRRLDVDFVEQAVKVARHVEGPVKVFWSREEDTRHSTLRPYHYNRLSASLDARGRPVAWHHRVTGSSILARWRPSVFKGELDGDAIRDAAGPYDFPSVRIEYVRQEPPPGFVTGFWRGVGHMQNAFPVECFMDELAHEAGADPIAFRKALLGKHPRAVRILDLAAERSNWNEPLPAGRGRGVGLTYCFASYAVQVAEVTVDPSSGNVTVDRITTVLDCGRQINPNSVVAQVQSGTVFGLTAVLYGNISIRDGHIEQGNFDTYPVLRMNEMPELRISVVDSSEEPGGLGEVATVMVAPAVLNAIYAATGKRIRVLPLDRGELRSAA